MLRADDRGKSRFASAQSPQWSRRIAFSALTAERSKGLASAIASLSARSWSPTSHAWAMNSRAYPTEPNR